MDLVAVQADEALLNMLAAGEFDDLLAQADALYDPERAAYAEMRLALVRVLSAWRRDVESEPFPETDLRLPEPKRSWVARVVSLFRRLAGGQR